MEGYEVFNGFEEIKLITHNVVITCIASPINILLLEQTVGRKIVPYLKCQLKCILRCLFPQCAYSVIEHI